MARIKSDFQPYTSPLHTPEPSPNSSTLVSNEDSGAAQLPDLLSIGDAAFETNQAVVVLCSTTRQILRRDERFEQLTGLPSSRTDALFDEVLVDEGDTKLLQNAIARVQLLSSGEPYVESLSLRITPGGERAIVDLRASTSHEGGILLRLTRTSLPSGASLSPAPRR